MSDRFNSQLWRDTLVRPLKRPLGRFAARGMRDTPSLTIVEGLRECPSCGLFQRIPRLAPGKAADCVRCGKQLARRRSTSPIATPAAFCIASAALYLTLLISTLMLLDVSGRENTVSLFTGPAQLLNEGYGEVGLLVGWVTIVTPGLVIAMMGAILYGASREHMPDWTPRVMRWYEATREWSMIEVYILGVFVAYSKLVDLASVDLLPGVFLVSGLMFTMAATDSTFDEELVWRNRDIAEEIVDDSGGRLPVRYSHVARHGMPDVRHMVSCSACTLVLDFGHPVSQTGALGNCPRCGHTLRRRKPLSQSHTISFLIAAVIFYIPANLFPVMTYTKLGNPDASTIIHGAIELWQAELYPLAILVVFASILVPVAKILSLAYMTEVTWRGQQKGLVALTKLYRIVDFIGRWSMIDVFMISILVAVVRFSFLANVTANFGCVCFAAVVILTIFAAHMYDPRSMWDAAALNGPVPADEPAGDGPGWRARLSRLFKSSKKMESERA